MSIRPSVPEIITVNSEALQTQIRDLLPSQNGFGSELQATNIITPIIDLTRTAEGSSLPVNLQQAMSFGSQTSYNITSGSQVLANSPGFWRIFGQLTISSNGSTAGSGLIRLDNGLTTKNIYNVGGFNLSTDIDVEVAEVLDTIVFLAAGESVEAVVSASGNQTFALTVRQVADGQGTLVQPNGFPL